VPVIVYVEASDACTTPDHLSIVCTITSSQPDDTTGNRKLTGDVDGDDGYVRPIPITLTNIGPGLYTALVLLRAERDATVSSGGTYSISISAEDASGNFGRASTAVVVPHDGKKQ